MTRIARPLLRWYDRNARKLPWRVANPDPYHVWLSEVMLQQTRISVVLDYFANFLSRWPTLEDLASASEDDVMRAWSGLGYYSRARNLKRCAELLQSEYGGKFPSDCEALKRLPGIGDYTASAIASICFGAAVPVVDGNVERVASRLWASDGNRLGLRQLIADALDPDRPGDFAQAMMDLGATICTPRNPSCSLCPLERLCIARREMNPQDYPRKRRRPLKPKRSGAAYAAIASDGSIYLVRRPPRGLLGGMAGLPSPGWDARNDGPQGEENAPFPVPGGWRKAGSVRHAFTHFELELAVWRAEAPDKGAAPLDGWWSPPDALDGEALPSLMRKAIRLLSSGGEGA